MNLESRINEILSADVVLSQTLSGDGSLTSMFGIVNVSIDLPEDNIRRPMDYNNPYNFKFDI